MTPPANIRRDNIKRLLQRSKLPADDLNTAIAHYLTKEQALAYKLVCEGRAHTSAEVRAVGGFRTVKRAGDALAWLESVGLLTRVRGEDGKEFVYGVG